MRWFLIILALLSVTAFFTNPAEEDLRGVLSQFVAMKVDEKLNEVAPPPANLPGPLGDLRERAKQALTPAITYSIGIRRDNFYLFSVFHLDVPPVPMEKEPPQCVIGAFKFVFIPLAKC
jgi:hypothetical protein